MGIKLLLHYLRACPPQPGQNTSDAPMSRAALDIAGYKSEILSSFALLMIKFLLNITPLFGVSGDGRRKWYKREGGV